MKMQEYNFNNNYQDYLASEYWQDIKREVWKKSRVCAICRVKKSLEVHHLTYTNLYKEKLKDLVLLCHKCHTRQHFNLFRKKTPLTKKHLRKRYRFLKLTYGIRTGRPSSFINGIYALYKVGKRH